jgi:hypothetical protein
MTKIDKLVAMFGRILEDKKANPGNDMLSYMLEDVRLPLLDLRSFTLPLTSAFLRSPKCPTTSSGITWSSSSSPAT